jgi:hypothetical protein
MTVRLTPTESDNSPPPQVPSQPEPPDAHQASGGVPASPATRADTVAEPAAGDGPTDGTPPPGDVGPPGPGDGRRALREARSQRRRTAWLCAAVVALCLALTIVVVTLARYRPAGPPTGVVTAALTSSPYPTSHASTTTSGVDRTPRPARPSLGAAAPEGGNP